MQADLILTNGRIYTVDTNHLWVEAVAVRNGKILAVGTNDEMLALAGPETETMDVGGRLVLPGFTDAHIHFLQVAVRRQQVSVFGMHDFDAVLAKVETAVHAAEPGQWVLGWGWDENLWDGVQPIAAHLDRIAPDTPVALARMDMHTWWVNSAALNIANVTRETANPPECTIERDENGNPNGILREWNALALVERHIPKPDEATLLKWMQSTIAEMHRVGITAVHDLRVENEGPQSFRLWQALNRTNALELRVHMHIASDFLPEAGVVGLQPGFGDDRLWLGHVKAFADGTMGSRTAFMLEPFAGEPENTGISVTSVEELWQLAVQAGQAGFPLSVHAIGDRAVREVLDVFQEHLSTPGAATVQLPHRIEHAQLLHPNDVAKLNDARIVASMQPVHLITDWATADKVWGERAQLTYAFRSLLDNGAILAFGSDAPVAPYDPMLGIYAAISRQDTDGNPAGGWYANEKMNMAEVIYAYTMGPAIVAGKQNVQGSITPGKWADLIVVSQDLFEIEPAAILDTQIDVTIFSSKVVYRR
ncbi:MAG: amidohydrolase [Chloroflexi bacterium]|nr:MAG: amidohydrolase [Chloroflexota bacterium]